MPSFHLATFSCDVTPPEGHPLCGGWIEPVRAVDDPLRTLGVVLLGMGQPIVLCAFDWCELRNSANDLMREAIAKATHTVSNRVVVQCIHQHNAPMADVEAQKIIETVPGAPANMDLKFFGQLTEKVGEAARMGLVRTTPFTHIGTGQAKIAEVASNRRIIGPDGKSKYFRGSATKDKTIRDEPEGLIDPWLKTLSFWNDKQPLAALHYYATHPMSYYGDGRVTSDFCGLARQKLQDDNQKIFQVYFTGCSGNVTAGKYNDGAKENRPILRDRMYEGMKAALNSTKTMPVDGWEWRVEPVKLPPRTEKSFLEEVSKQDLEDPKQSLARRGNAAVQLAWLKRLDKPIDFTCLDFGKVLVAHLPGEPFIEYQLRAQELRKDAFVCVAGYGDGGPGYIPTAQAYFEGGYEPSVALAGPKCEEIMIETLRKLLKPSKP